MHDCDKKNRLQNEVQEKLSEHSNAVHCLNASLSV